jgi:hypothetical protein
MENLMGRPVRNATSLAGARVFLTKSLDDAEGARLEEQITSLADAEGALQQTVS